MVSINKKIILLISCYVLIVHAIFVIILLKTDLLHMISYKLGIGSSSLELSDYFKKLVTHQLRLDKNVPKDSILYFGDSLIQELCVNAISKDGINYGIGGDTTYGLLWRIPKYQSKAHAKAIIVAIGLNDLRYRDKSAILANYKKILSFLPDDKPIIFSAILPVDEGVSKKRVNATIEGINEELRQLSLSVPKKVYFIDSRGGLTDAKGNLSSHFHIGDGIHLNEAGYKVWIKELKEVLALALSTATDVKINVK